MRSVATMMRWLFSALLVAASGCKAGTPASSAQGEAKARSAADDGKSGEVEAEPDPVPEDDSASPLGVGDRAPSFELPAADGKTVTLEGLLANGPAVLVFYRGDW